MAIRLTDQLGSEVLLPKIPSRIVSLVPSQTELLYDLGLDKEVIGITKFCVHPLRWRTEKKIVGGTKNVDLGLIEELRPDLVIGNKEENEMESIQKIKQKFPVWMSDIVSLKDAEEMIISLGSLTNREEQSGSITNSIHESFQLLKPWPSLRTLYLIWRSPWMAAGTETFINTMLEKLGLVNVCRETRYPQLTTDQIIDFDPQLVLLSSEPFPFREKHIHELQQLLPKPRIMLADGEMFSWYGSRMMHAPAYFNSIRIE